MAIITISRGSMSGGEALARCLSRALGYPVLAREVLVEAAARLGMPEEELRDKIQSSSGPLQSLQSDRRIYLLALQSALADQCTSGNLVYHGHAGHFLLKDLPCVLKVRLIAPMANRIRAVIERQNLDPVAARQYIKYVDQERIEWTKFVYGVDWRDPRNYDLIINLRNISLETACALVSSVVKLPAYANTDALQQELRDFALACRVQVALARSPECREMKFGVRAHHGSVEVFENLEPGIAVSKARPGDEEITRVAQAVEGVKEVTVQVRNSGDVGRVA